MSDQINMNSYDGWWDDIGERRRRIGSPGPPGADGPQGPQGLTYDGTWDSGGTYLAGDVVQYLGSSYVKLDDDVALAPPNAHWDLLAAKGDIGAEGPQGPPGELGGTIDWANVDNKPTVFPPDAHAHPQSDVTGLVTALAGLAPLVHTHVKANITDFAHTHLAPDLPDATTLAKGVVELATSAEVTAGLAVQASDTRLSDARTALSHSHLAADVPKLDALTAPDDNTTLDASTAKHGLLKKLPGGTDTFLRGDGAFAAPVAVAGNPTYNGTFTLATTEYKVMADDLQLNGTEEATLQGNSSVVIF